MQLGDRFGRLVLICDLGTVGPHRFRKWRVRCDCGIEYELLQPSLHRGRSCGCLKREKLQQRMTKHGKASTPLHNVWIAMKQRCNNPRNANWHKYGARGIAVCERWQNSFENFAADVGYPPDATLGKWSLDRIDNNRGYEPGNVRWATPLQQASNTRTVSRLTLRGVTRTRHEWAELIGISSQVISHRLRRGWTTEQALLTPLRRRLPIGTVDTIR